MPQSIGGLKPKPLLNPRPQLAPLLGQFLAAHWAGFNLLDQHEGVIFLVIRRLLVRRGPRPAVGRAGQAVEGQRPSRVMKQPFHLLMDIDLRALVFLFAELDDSQLVDSLGPVGDPDRSDDSSQEPDLRLISWLAAPGKRIEAIVVVLPALPRKDQDLCPACMSQCIEANARRGPLHSVPPRSYWRSVG